MTSPLSRFTWHTVTSFLLRDHFWHYLMHTHSTLSSPSHLTWHPLPSSVSVTVLLFGSTSGTVPGQTNVCK